MTQEEIRVGIVGADTKASWAKVSHVPAINGLAGLKKHFANFSEVFEKVGTHLKNVQQSYQEADKRLDKTATALEGMLDPGEPAKPLSTTQESLPLTSLFAKNGG